MKFYPYENGDTKRFEVVLTQELEVLAILMGGGTKSFHPLKVGAQKFLPCLEGGRGVQKNLDPRFSHFVAPPSL